MDKQRQQQETRVTGNDRLGKVVRCLVGGHRLEVVEIKC